MISKLASRNSKKDRINNGLYFGSMIVSIISFYIILSLSNQNVMIFLKSIESDAVDKLLSIIPIFYIATLFILLFVVYFSSKMQLERRRKEFGLYLILGMRRSKLFLMILLEDLFNSIIALAIGLPTAIIISEITSIFTIKMIGINIISHKFSLSVTGVLLTIIGFFSVKLIANIFLSSRISTKEIGELLRDEVSGTKKKLPKIIYLIIFILGLFILGLAYFFGISGQAWESINNMGITILLGIVGTIMIFYGLRLFIEFIVKLGKKRKLHVYNFRQIQELVINNSTSLAISSLLIFVALSLFGAGVTISTINKNNDIHIFDYTFYDHELENQENFDSKLMRNKFSKLGLESSFSNIIDIKIGEIKDNSRVSFENIVSELNKLEYTDVKEDLINRFGQYDYSYFMPISEYNEVRKLANLPILSLDDNEALLYMDKDIVIGEEIINTVLKKSPKVKVGEDNLELKGELESLNMFADSLQNYSILLIVNDNYFSKNIKNNYSSYVNAVLNHELVENEGLMQSILDINEKLDKISIDYGTYLQDFGRQLFFIVAISYLTIYLSIILLVVANTIIGVQFLMWQSKSHKRYKVLTYLGADKITLQKSTNKQINWYFGLTIFIAVINSIFGVASLFSGILPSSAKVNFIYQIKIAIIIIFLLFLVELIYISIVKKNSYKFLSVLDE